ncbi:hypothetical protein BGZ92_004574, partial [Podila epicladia]
MIDNKISLCCVVDGESISFPVKIESTETIGDLKDAIKTALSPQFDDIAAKDLTLWRVSISLVPLKDRKPIILKQIDSAEELDPGNDISDEFEERPPKKTIHIIVQRPPQ